MLPPGRSMTPLSRQSGSDSGEHQSSSLSTSSQSPQKWYQRSWKVPSQESSGKQSSRRLRGISSIKDLARRASHQALKPGTIDPHPNIKNAQSLRSRSASVPRLPGDPKAARCRPPTLIIPKSTHPSLESLTPDLSGLSNDISQPETPASADALHFHPLEDVKVLYAGDMGNSPSKTPAVIRKPVPPQAQGKQMPLAKTEIDKSSDTSKEQPTEKAPSAVLRHRTSTVQVPIPRRRSSLTTLHLDRTHFETPVTSKQGNFDIRASSFSENFRPATTSPKSATPTPQPQNQGALSPAILSPSLSTSRPSTASTQTKSPVSPGLTHIHLPATFPNGPIATPVPPLTKLHYHCYQFHKRVRYSQNKTCPVPCMTCGLVEGDSRWKCIWCALRICGGCMSEFDGMGRDLEKLMKWLAQQEEKKKAVDGDAKPGNPSNKSIVTRNGSATSRSKDGSQSADSDGTFKAG